MAPSPSSPAVALVLLSLMASLALSAAAVYKVGDATGWTILGSPNYTAWAASKTFTSGDTLVFEYNKAFHNVLEVNKTDYKECNAASPRVTYTTGNDSITLKRKGHYFFICGIPSHCGLGQKVDIRIPKLASTSSLSPSISPSVAPAPPANKSGEHGSGSRSGAGWAVYVVAAAAFTGLVMT